MLRATLKGSFYITTGLAFVKFLSIIYTAVLARALGPDGLGILNLAQVMVPWFIAASSFSLQTVATQFISAAHSRKEDVFPVKRGLLLLTLLLGLFAALIHFGFSGFVARRFFHNESLSPYVSLASWVILFSVLFNVILGIERGLKRFRSYALLESLKQFFLLFFGVFFVIFLGYGVTGALAALIISPALLLLFYLLQERKIFSSSETTIQGMLPLGFSLVLVAFVLSFFMSIDRFILGFLQSPATVGFYAVSFTVVNLGFYLVGGIKNTMFPFLAEQFSKTKNIREREFVSYFSRVVVLTLVLVGLFMISILAFRHELIPLVFGKEYSPSIPLLSIMLFGLPFLTLYIFLHTLSISINRVKAATIASILATLLAVVIYYMLTRLSGVQGTAYGFVVSSFLLSLFYYFFILRDASPDFKGFFGLITLSCLIALGVVFFTAGFLWNILIFFTALFIYGSLLLLFGFVRKEDLQFAQQLIRRYLPLFRRSPH